MLDEEDHPLEEPEDSLLHPPSQVAASLSFDASPGHVGLTRLAYAVESVQVCKPGNDVQDPADFSQDCQVKGCHLTCPTSLFQKTTSLKTTSVNLPGEKILHTSTVVKEAPITRMSMPPALTCIQADSGMTGEQFDHATHGLRSALLASSSEAEVRQNLVSAYFSCHPPKEKSCESEVTVSSPHSVSSGETCVNIPDQATSPIILGATRSNLETTLHHEDKDLSEEQSLDDLSFQKVTLEVALPVLPPCCNKVKEEWEHTVKIIEGNQETEFANMKDDLDALQESRHILEMENTHLTQDHKETLRKLREKSKEVRELKRQLKTKSETPSATADLERSQADTARNLENDFQSQTQELEKTYKKAMQELKNQHHSEVDELGRALDIKSEELSKKEDLMQDWKDKAIRLQTQHDDVCQGGVSCTQQIDNLKLQLGKQKRWLRQTWPTLQHELQDANTKLAVAQQNLEKAEEKACNDTIKATRRFSRLELKWRITSEELMQTKKMLLADDAKALSVGILQESADEMANLMTQNHDRTVEVLDLYQKRDIILQGHQDQINACYAYIGELEVDKESIRATNQGLEGDYMILNGRYQSLQQEYTDLQMMFNDVQIAKNNLQISHYNLTGTNTALRANNESLKLRNTWLENERSKLQEETKAISMQDARLQHEKSSIGPHGSQSQQSVAKPESKKATVDATKISLQDQIDEAYLTQGETFAAVRHQPKSWINMVQKTDDSSKNPPNASHVREATPFPPLEHSSSETSPQDNAAHIDTSASHPQSNRFSQTRWPGSRLPPSARPNAKIQQTWHHTRSKDPTSKHNKRMLRHRASRATTKVLRAFTIPLSRQIQRPTKESSHPSLTKKRRRELR